MSPLDKRRAASETQRRDIIGSWIFVTLWCGGTFPMFYLAAFKSFDAFGAVVSGILALVGVSMLWLIIRMTLDFMKFGVVSFTPQRGPVRPGGQLVALVEFLDNPPTSFDIEAELQCLHVTWNRGMRGGTEMSEETAWSATGNFRLRKTGLGAIAAITFDIPADAIPTDLPGERPGASGWMRFKLEQGKPLHFHRWGSGSPPECRDWIWSAVSRSSLSRSQKGLRLPNPFPPSPARHPCSAASGT